MQAKERISKLAGGFSAAETSSGTSVKRLFEQLVQWTSDRHAGSLSAGWMGGGRASEGGQLQRGTTGSRHTRAGVAAEFKAQAATATGLRRRLRGRRRTSQGRPVASGRANIDSRVCGQTSGGEVEGREVTTASASAVLQFFGA